MATPLPEQPSVTLTSPGQAPEEEKQAQPQPQPTEQAPVDQQMQRAMPVEQTQGNTSSTQETIKVEKDTVPNMLMMSPATHLNMVAQTAMALTKGTQTKIVNPPNLKTAPVEELYLPFKANDSRLDALQVLTMKNDVGMFVQYNMRKAKPLEHPIPNVIKTDDSGREYVDYGAITRGGGFVTHIRTRQGPVPVSSLSERDKMAMRNKYSALAGFNPADPTLVPKGQDVLNQAKDAVTGKRQIGMVNPYNIGRNNQHLIERQTDLNGNPEVELVEPSWFETLFKGDVLRSALEPLDGKRPRLPAQLEVEENEDLTRLRKSYQNIGLDEVKINSILRSLAGGEYRSLRNTYAAQKSYQDLANTVRDVISAVPVAPTTLEQFKEGLTPISPQVLTVDPTEEKVPEYDDRLLNLPTLMTTAWAFMTDIVKGNTDKFPELRNAVDNGRVDFKHVETVAPAFAEELGISVDKAEKVLALAPFWTDQVYQVGMEGAGLTAAVGLTMMTMGRGRVNKGLVPYLKANNPKLANETSEQVIKRLATDPKFRESSKRAYVNSYLPSSNPFFLTSLRRTFQDMTTDIYIQATGPARAARIDASRKLSGELIEEGLSGLSKARTGRAASRAANLTKAMRDLGQGYWLRTTGGLSPFVKGEAVAEVGFSFGAGAAMYYGRKHYGADGDATQTILEVGGGFAGALAGPKAALLAVSKVAGLSTQVGNMILNLPYLSANKNEFIQTLRDYHATLDYTKVRKNGVETKGTKQVAMSQRDLERFYTVVMRDMTLEQRQELVEKIGSWRTLVTELSELPNSTITEEDLPLILGDLVMSGYLKGIGDYTDSYRQGSSDILDFQTIFDTQGTLIDQRVELQERLFETLGGISRLEGARPSSDFVGPMPVAGAEQLSEQSRSVLQKTSEYLQDVNKDLDQTVEQFQAARAEFMDGFKNILRDGEASNGALVATDIARLYDNTVAGIQSKIDELAPTQENLPEIQKLVNEMDEIQQARLDGIANYMDMIKSGASHIDEGSVAARAQLHLMERHRDLMARKQAFYKELEARFGDVYGDYTEQLTRLYTRQTADQTFYPELFEETPDLTRRKAIEVNAKTPKQGELGNVAVHAARRFWEENLNIEFSDGIATPKDFVGTFLEYIPENMKKFQRYKFEGKNHMDAFVWYRNFLSEVTPSELSRIIEEDETGDAAILLRNLDIEEPTQEAIDEALEKATLDLTPIEVDQISRGLNRVIRSKTGSDQFLATEVRKSFIYPENVAWVRNKYNEFEPLEADEDFVTFYNDGMNNRVRPFYATFDDPALKDVGEIKMTVKEAERPSEDFVGPLPSVPDVEVVDGGLFTKLLGELDKPGKVNLDNPIDTHAHITNQVIGKAAKSFGRYDPATNRHYLIAGDPSTEMFKALLIQHYRDKFLSSDSGAYLTELVEKGNIPRKAVGKEATKLNLDGIDFLSQTYAYKLDPNTGRYVVDETSPLLSEDDVFSMGTLEKLVDTKYAPKIEKAENLIVKELDQAEAAVKKAAADNKNARKALDNLINRETTTYSDVTDATAIYNAMKSPKGLKDFSSARQFVLENHPDELAYFDGEMAHMLTQGLASEVSTIPSVGVKAGRRIMSIDKPTEIITSPKYESLRDALQQFAPDTFESLRLIHEMNERIMKRPSGPDGIRRPAKDLDWLAILNRGRQIQLRQVSPTYVAMEIAARNLTHRSFNHAAAIYSSPELTRALIEMVESGRPITQAMDNSKMLLFIRGLLRGMANADDEQIPLNAEGENRSKDIATAFEEQRATRPGSYFVPNQFDYDKAVNKFRKYNPNFKD